MTTSKSTQVHPATPAPDSDRETKSEDKANGDRNLGGPATGLVIVHRLEMQATSPAAAAHVRRDDHPGNPAVNLPQPQPSGSRPIRSVFRGALQVVMVVVRNALGCLLCAFAANFCYSLGNVFSLRKSVEQSTDSLSVATMVWSNLLFCTLQLLTHTTMLLPNRFLSDPTRRPSTMFCMKKLTRKTFKYFIASTLLMTAWAEVVNKLLPKHLRPIKLNFYIGAILIHVYSTGIDLATRTIFSEETCQGQARRERMLAATAIADAAAADRVGTSPGPRIPVVRRGQRSYWRIFVKTFPKVLITMFAGVYVQIASRSDIFSHGPAIVAFAIVSYAVKLVIQELAQVYALRHNIEQIRVMCVLVGVPTVLIDTQVRIVLLGVQSGQFAVAGTLVMGIVEVVMRSGKMLLLNFEIKHRLRAIERQSRTASPSTPSSASRATSGQRPNRVRPNSAIRRALTFSGRAVTSQVAFERWKKQRVDFHTVEIIADMYAEYIAIGCSASILYFFSDHPKYQYGEQSSAQSSSPAAHGSAVSSSSLYQSLVLQFGVEVVVDFLSCALEIASDAHFESVRKLSSYLAFMFMTIAVVNIGISSFLYLK